MADDPISPELALIDPALAGNPTREGGPMIDPLEPPRAGAASTNGAGPAHAIPPVETLLYEAGLITADLLGELVRDSVVSGRSVAEVAVERGLATPQVIQALFAQAGAAFTPLEIPAAATETPVPTVIPAFIELADEPVLPSPFLERVDEPAANAWGHVLPAAPDRPEPEDAITLLPEVPAQGLLSVVPPSVQPAPAGTEVLETPTASVMARTSYTLMLRLQSGERMIVETATTFDDAVNLARELAGRFAAAAEWPLVGGRFIRPETIVSVDVERALEA